jgi:5-methylcytosine-specific restriction endonuclease McrA
MTSPSNRRFSRSDRAALFVAAGGVCTRCGRPLDNSFHADHVKPWSEGGITDVLNGQALCATCNLRKGATH